MSILVEDDFWQYMLDNASNSDNWWLEDWLKEQLGSYQKEEACSHCASRRKELKHVYASVGNWVLEVRIVCRECNKVLEVRDYREKLRKAIADGLVRVCDVEILKREGGF